MTEVEQAIREAAYYIWQNEGCPKGRAEQHWHRALAAIQENEELIGEEEKIMADRADANLPALLTKDVRGG